MPRLKHRFTRPLRVLDLHDIEAEDVHNPWLVVDTSMSGGGTGHGPGQGSSRGKKTVKIVSTLEIAQLHCNDPRTCKPGVWFDGYQKIGN